MIRSLVDERMTTCRAVLVQEHSQAMVAAKVAADDTSKLTEYMKDQVGKLDSRVQFMVSDHVSFRSQTEEIIADLRKNSNGPAASDGAVGSLRASLSLDAGGKESKIAAQEAKDAVKALRSESQQQMDRILERVSKMDLRLEATGRLMG